MLYSSLFLLNLLQVVCLCPGVGLGCGSMGHMALPLTAAQLGQIIDILSASVSSCVKWRY